MLSAMAVAVALQAPPAPATPPGRYAHEEEWIASSIVRDIVDMATMGTSAPPPPVVKVRRTNNWERPSSAYIEVRLPGPIALVHQVTLQPHAWAPGAYLPIARDVVARVGGKPSPSPVTDGALARLTDLRAATLGQESKRIGARLSSVPLDPHAHEEAALTFLALALRERANDWSDVRHSLNRATAHLALADALRGGGAGAGATGRIARIALDVLAGRQVPALAAMDAAERTPLSAPEAAWVRALRLRITEDWRKAGARRGTLLERLQEFAAFKGSFSGLRGLDHLRSTQPEDVPDWAWIMFEDPPPGVQEANPFARAAMQQTLAEVALVLGQPPAALTAARIAAAMDVVPGPAVRTTGSTRTIEVLDAGTWGQFHGRHLLHAAQSGDTYFRELLGLPREADAFWAEVEKHLGQAELFPVIAFLRAKEIERQGRAPGVLPEASLRSLCAPLARRLRRAPETVMPDAWRAFLRSCDKEKANTAIPDMRRWFPPPTLPGNAQAAGVRIRVLGTNPQDSLASMKAIAPYDEGVVFYWRKEKPRETAAEAAAAYGPRAEYSVSVLRRVAGSTENPAEKRPLLQKACEVSADDCLALGRALAALGDTAGAVQAYEKALRDAQDRVAVGNLIGWLAEHYVAQRRTADAERVARAAAEAYSATGLAVAGDVFEKLGRMAEAEALFASLATRYPGTLATKVFYVRAARRPGGERFAARSREVIAQAFPRGLERVSIGALSGPPSDGAEILTETTESARLGLAKGHVMVALDGYRIRGNAQYQLVRAMSDAPEIAVIAWDGRQYRELRGSFPNRKFGSTFKDYKPPGAKP